ncbi:hypothetical protein HanPI659440_Chr14g0544161 [Helianthus annuus]|nr:hypothetical protein HanPI659440_Chr14g0544161 [Helianthus annuus]
MQLELQATINKAIAFQIKLPKHSFLSLLLSPLSIYILFFLFFFTYNNNNNSPALF